MILSRKQRYLQVALNATAAEAEVIIRTLPPNPRIIIEAGTPLIKAYGMAVIRQIYQQWQMRLSSVGTKAYVVADLKTMDRALTEVSMVKMAGASAAVCLGQAPVETVNSFIESCRKSGIDSMVDMMNIEYPVKILR